jgi:nitroreductase
MSAAKHARHDHPIHELLASRWSPYAFSSASVPEHELRALFEAARWAPSSYNEQPWAYIVARKENAPEFAKALSCLVEANQAWAKNAPVLAIGLARTTFARNASPNRAAQHDLGLASANLTLEAGARGLHVHQMVGIDPSKVREVFKVPADVEPLTALAIGRAGNPDDLPAGVRERDLAPRQRNPLKDFVFDTTWQHPAAIL